MIHHTLGIDASQILNDKTLVFKLKFSMENYLLYYIVYSWALVGITNSAFEENTVSYLLLREKDCFEDIWSVY